jgi:hypothetical protein
LKFTLPGLDVSCPCTPAPLSATEAGAALLVIAIEPVALPVVVGLKLVVNVAEAPALIVIGIEAPLMLKPAPDVVAAVIVSVALPEFVRFTVCVPVEPTFTLPKLTFGLPTVSCAWPAVAVPLIAICSGELGALLEIATLPFAVPAAVGANFTPNETLEPAAIVAGVEMPVTLYAAPEAVTEFTVTAAVPPFVSVTFCVLVVPVSWLAKVSVEGFAVKLPSVPTPVTGTVMFASLAELTTAMLPFTVPAVVGANCAVKVALWPAAIVAGSEMPVTLNAAPVAVTEFTVKLALPVFCRVTVCVPLLDTVTLPKFTLPGFAVNVEVADVALPCIVITCGEPGALSVKVIVPVAAPVVVGAKLTLNETVWPAVICFGSVKPEMPKPLPATVAILIVTFVLPVFVKVTVCDALWFTCTFEKFSVEGAIERPACVAVPVKEIVSGEFVALLTTVSEPVAAPSVVGANCIDTVLLCPTAKVVAALPLVTVKPAPASVAADTVTEAVPVFVTVTVCVALPPTATLPNVKVVALAESTPAPGSDGAVFAALV